VGLIDDIPTCQEVIDRMVTEAEECIRGRLSAMLSESSSSSTLRSRL